jgi:hypothetical protein
LEASEKIKLPKEFIMKIYFLWLLILLLSCNTNDNEKVAPINQKNIATQVTPSDTTSDFFSHLADSAASLMDNNVVYDPAYSQIAYPNGDVPSNKGVCCDVIIRAYRKMGIDLQKEVHEDMNKHFKEYPQKWGRLTPDKNIDHRRVPNLLRFFERQKALLPVTTDGKDYAPGDVIFWELSNQPHVGLVVKDFAPDKSHHLIIHLIGSGQAIADRLFVYKIVGHARYTKQ